MLENKCLSHEILKCKIINGKKSYCYYDEGIQRKAEEGQRKNLAGRHSTEQYVNLIRSTREKKSNYGCTYFYFEERADVVNLRRRSADDPGSSLSI